MVKCVCVFSVTHDYAEIPLLSVFTVWTEYECFLLLLQKHQAGAANWKFYKSLVWIAHIQHDA